MSATVCQMDITDYPCSIKDCGRMAVLEENGQHLCVKHAHPGAYKAGYDDGYAIGSDAGYKTGYDAGWIDKRDKGEE